MHALLNKLGNRWFRKGGEQSPEQDAQSIGAVRYRIDQFSVFGSSLVLSGWVWKPGVPVASVFLRIPENTGFEVRAGMPSPGLAAALGEDARSARFDGHWHVPLATARVVEATLVVTFEDRSVLTIDKLGARGLVGDASNALVARFVKQLASSPPGALLELGSRARSGISRRSLVPSSWKYTGMDVLGGENVDVVGDAHKLSRLFPGAKFDAVMSFSVLEHILMPWKVAIELNQVMCTGGIGFFKTHQCWPIHDQPWDYWRFSSDAWKALFNQHTGFEIIDAQMGEPAFVVARNCHPATNFGYVPGGYLSSAVLFRKTGETNLRWDVDIDDVVDAPYPSTTTKFPHL